MCEDLPCVTACPSGALDPALTDIDQARMGLAVLVDRENCLSWQGMRCDACHRACPLGDKAITLEPQQNARIGGQLRFLVVVDSGKCTGCGKCEQACVRERAAIKVLPVALAKGDLGSDYRLGRKQKDARVAGGAK
jgi:ferredoxin-type protein NapG